MVSSAVASPQRQAVLKGGEGDEAALVKEGGLAGEGHGSVGPTIARYFHGSQPQMAMEE